MIRSRKTKRNIIRFIESIKKDDSSLEKSLMEVYQMFTNLKLKKDERWVLKELKGYKKEEHVPS